MKNISGVLFILLIQLLLSGRTSLAQNVSAYEARFAAMNLYLDKVQDRESRIYSLNDFYQPIPVGNEPVVYYVVNVRDGGYILISADKKAMPVIAYSFDENFNITDPLPCNIASWLGKCKNEILEAISSGKTNPIVAREWDRLLMPRFSPDKAGLITESVAPLLVSKWNQPWPYNGMCPADPAGSHGHCVTGCVATAMGQLLYYYRFPYQGQGSYSYMHPDYGTIAANFDTTYYDWNGMTTAPAERNDAIACLLFHQGVSVDMDYGPNSSGMWNHKAAYSLKNHFRYGPETQYYFRDSITLDWDSILIANLNQRKPLYYAGWEGVQSNSGHAFVCDGYQGTDFFHFNWGWGGSYDGYFYLNALNPGGSNFNYAQEVIPLFPDTLLNNYPVYPSGQIVLTSLNGSIEDGSGWYKYRNNTSDSWLIAPADPETDSITSIQLTFRAFETEANTDFVSLYDGENTSAPLLGTFSGTTLPPAISSTGNKLLVVFSSNSSVNKNGWLADYTSILPIYCNGTTTLSAATGNVSDGSGDKNYGNNSNCRWKIMPPNAKQTIFTFTSFETVDSSDFVRILDIGTQAVLGTFYGNQVPPPVVSSGKMMIIFSTDDSGKAGGWEGYYSSSLQDVDEKGRIAVDIYPNPASEKVILSLFSQKSSTVFLELHNSMGINMLNKQYQINQGMNKIELDISGLSDSAYFLILRSDELNEVLKLMVFH